MKNFECIEYCLMSQVSNICSTSSSSKDCDTLNSRKIVIANIAVNLENLRAQLTSSSTVSAINLLELRIRTLSSRLVDFTTFGHFKYKARST